MHHPPNTRKRRNDKLQHYRFHSVSSKWRPGSRTLRERRPLASSRRGIELLIGNWINEGVTIEAENPSVPIVTSDVYEWVPGRYFVIHSAYGMIGDTSVGGVEIIGVTGDGYSSAFYDSFGNTHSSRMEIVGHVITWTGERKRCMVTITEGGSTQLPTTGLHRWQNMDRIDGCHAPQAQVRSIQRVPCRRNSGKELKVTTAITPT